MQAQGATVSMRSLVRLSLSSISNLRSLYAGIGAVLAGSIPTHAIVFGVFQYSKKQLDHIEDRRLAIDFVCAAVGELVSLSVYVPSEVVAKRMQVAGGTASPIHSYRNSAHALKTIVRTEGVRGLYTGLVSTAARDIPFTALQLMLFEKFKRAAGVAENGASGSSSGGVGLNALLGGLSGGIAAAITTPFDMAKTKLQTSKHFRGVFQCLSSTYRDRGVKGLFRGVVPRVLWVAPASAITLSIYEQSVPFFANAFKC